MERAISSEERIRRAEEIYNRRRMQSGVRVPTARVNASSNDKYKLYKKLILQIAICFVLYFIFYLIKNSNYIFSEEFINKTRAFLSYDINFENAYNVVVEYYNDNIKSYFLPVKEDDNEENDNENNINEIQANTIMDNVVTEEGGIGGGEDNTLISSETQETNSEPEVQLSQMEIDANEIKNNYSLILPLTGTITSRYGPREKTQIVSANHAGIDIGANEGTVFTAAMSGTVITASGEGSYGNHIFIKEGDVITVYAHCKTLYVKEGDVITQGQKLGEVGSTGNATGPHLHFEIRKNERTVNPEYVLQFA